MSERTHLLVQQWLQQSPLANAPVAELEQLTTAYPYFSAAQLFLLTKLDAAAEGYAAQKRRAALHVYNPMQVETAAEMFEFPFDDEITDAAADTLVEAREVHPIDVDADAVPVTTEEKEQQKENQTFEAPLQEASAVSDLPIEIETRDVTPEAENTIIPTVTTVAPEASILTTPAEENKTEQPAEPPIKMPSLDLSSPAAAADITFEPYHTVDYFASQGIKLSQAEIPGDKFGKQLKSFTEWLKTMKKLPTTAVTSNTDGVGEKKVEHLAAHSLQNADIITESMAEVWVKQGNKEKASEVYNKLSLQNPSKKAYFAAKIESLKKPS